MPTIYKQVKKEFPDVMVAFAGTGPAEKKLKKEMPDAVFLGWVDHKKLPDIYSAADLLVLPSIFDTFGCVVVEAMSCGTPVISYNSKGPKDIIEHEKNGYLASRKKDFGTYAAQYLKDTAIQKKMKENALAKASEYNASAIMDKLVKDAGLT